jgi:hypothetical protein
VEGEDVPKAEGGEEAPAENAEEAAPAEPEVKVRRALGGGEGGTLRPRPLLALLPRPAADVARRPCVHSPACCAARVRAFSPSLSPRLDTARTPSPPIQHPPNPQELSLDEYEALLAEKKAALNKARAERKVDPSELTGLKELGRRDSEEVLQVGAKEKKVRAKELKVPEKVETAFKFDAGEPRPEFGRGRGGRGGRGGDRGGRGGDRGGARGPPREGGRGRGPPREGGRGEGGRGPAPPRANGPAADINVTDASAFPALA